MEGRREGKGGRPLGRSGKVSSRDDLSTGEWTTGSFLTRQKISAPLAPAMSGQCSGRSMDDCRGGRAAGQSPIPCDGLAHRARGSRGRSDRSSRWQFQVRLFFSEVSIN